MNLQNLEESFLSVCSDYLEQNKGFDVRGELGVYSNASVVWLGISQRYSGGTLQDGVMELISRVESGRIDSLVRRPGRNLRDGKVSIHTGGLSRARERISEDFLSSLFDAATEKIFNQLDLNLSSHSVYVMDGQVLAISRTESNLEEFGKTGNGQGELHFPRIRAVSVHELTSGIAKNVAIGTWREHEVTIARRAISNLPRGAILIIDRGFDKPSFLRFARERGILVVVRIKSALGKKLLGTTEAPCAEKEVEWKSKTVDGLITEKGRVIKFTSSIKLFRSSEFYFFTTANNLSLEQVADLYRQRVRVETFIREIKQTLKMFFASAKKPENIKKEIIIAYLTFNLIRCVMQDCAQKTGTDPRRISFKTTIRLMKAYAYSFANAKNRKEIDQVAERFRGHLSQAKIPIRNKDRSYPRVIKYPRDRYKKAGMVSGSQDGER